MITLEEMEPFHIHKSWKVMIGEVQIGRVDLKTGRNQTIHQPIHFHTLNIRMFPDQLYQVSQAFLRLGEAQDYLLPVFPEPWPDQSIESGERASTPDFLKDKALSELRLIMMGLDSP